MPTSLPLVSTLALAFLLTGCSLAGDETVSVRGRVVDAVTGQPVDPGLARVTVTGASFLGPTETVVSAAAGADGRFDLSETAREGVGEFSVAVGSTGQIDYPGLDQGTLPFSADLLRPAYFVSELPYRADVGTVELLPTCLTAGEVRLSRPLASSERLVVTIGSVPEAPLGVRLGANGFTYEGSPGPDYTTPEPLRLLSVGGRPARLDWEISQYNPPTGNGGGVFARGSVPLGACPRHGVLRYTAAVDLP